MAQSIHLYSSISGVPQLFTKIYKHKCILGYRIEKKTAFASLKRVLLYQITITGSSERKLGKCRKSNEQNGMCAFTVNEHFNQNWSKN